MAILPIKMVRANEKLTGGGSHQLAIWLCSTVDLRCSTTNRSKWFVRACPFLVLTWYPPWKLTFLNPKMKFWFRWYSSLNRWFSGSMFISQGVICCVFLSLLFNYKGCDRTWWSFRTMLLSKHLRKGMTWMLVFLSTVDGRNIPPVDSLSHYLPGFCYIPRCRISEPSTVWKNCL